MSNWLKITENPMLGLLLVSIMLVCTGNQAVLTEFSVTEYSHVPAIRLATTTILKVHVDGNWSETAAIYDWCTGSGTHGDPYVIKDLIIDGGGNGSCILIENTWEYFRIENCTLFNSGGYPNAGIELSYVGNGAVVNNTSSSGISLSSSHNNTVVGNDCIGNSYWGIHLESSNDNIVSGNNCTGNFGEGIILYSSSNNTVTGNACMENSREGIGLIFSSNNNIVTGNNCTGNYDPGILLHGNSNKVMDNICMNNSHGIYFMGDSDSNMVVGNNCTGNHGDGIFLYSSVNDTVTVNNCTENSGFGIFFSSSDNGTVTYNDCTGNSRGGIFLGGPTLAGNTVTGNNCSRNSEDGIWLAGSGNNTVTGNDCSGNSRYGMYLFSEEDPIWGICDNNTLSRNNCTGNYYGIVLKRANSNILYLNNFMNNDANVYSYVSVNRWYSPGSMTYLYTGKTCNNYLGNYWSDYTGSDIDSDGIGDSPYSMDGESDSYPLMERFEHYGIEDTTPPAAVTDLRTLNITSTGFIYPTGSSGPYQYAGWLAGGPEPDMPPYEDGYYHLGQDMDASEGDDVHAIADGEIIYVSVSGWGEGNYGLLVKHVLNTGEEFLALYGHVRPNSLDLRVTDSETIDPSVPVMAGEAFATIGPFIDPVHGNIPHLHFGIRPGTDIPLSPWGRMPVALWNDTNGFVNPVDWITTRIPCSPVDPVSSIVLAWTAPGDDATVYDIRYSASEITESNWGLATRCTGESAPRPAGSSETFVVKGFSPGITCYFALKTADEEQNWSSLSNAVMARAEPSLLTAGLFPGWDTKELFVPIYYRSPDEPGSMVLGIGNKRDMWYLVKVYRRTTDQFWEEIHPWFLPYLAPWSEKTFSYTPEVGEEIKLEVWNDLNDETLSALWTLDFATRALLGVSIAHQVTGPGEFVNKLITFYNDYLLMVGDLATGDRKQAVLGFVNKLAEMLVTDSQAQEVFVNLLKHFGIEVTIASVISRALLLPVHYIAKIPVWWSLRENAIKNPFMEDVIFTVKSTLPATTPEVKVTQSLTIDQNEPYHVGETINARFEITNRGTAPLTLNILTVGGRGPKGDADVRDFTFKTNVILNPGDSYSYEGELALLDNGSYHFFIAYQTLDGEWVTSVPTGAGNVNTVDIHVNPMPERWIIAELGSPAELRVYDSTGNITGLVSGEVKTEIPCSTYYENSVILPGIASSYRFEVAGVGTGWYDLTITNITEQGSSTFNATGIPISTKAVHHYTVDWAILSLNGEGVTIQIDSDGDGIFEETINADDDLTYSEFSFEITPEIVIIIPANTTYTSTNVWLNFTINKSTPWIGYSLDDYANVTVTGNVLLMSLSEGVHHVVVFASDTSGNTGRSRTTWFTVVTTGSATTTEPPVTTDSSTTPGTSTSTATTTGSGATKASTAPGFTAMTWLVILIAALPLTRGRRQ